MTSNARKRQDEQSTKIVRELASLPANRNCFDCGQRGPTYVNMTIGSYVCTTCSGLLRGLHPPHRIKSISMASFTPEEIEFLKATGNELCNTVYYALFDGKQSLPEDSSKNAQAVRDFLTLKYEKRQWYVAPSAQQHEEARRQNNAALARIADVHSASRFRSSTLPAPKPNFPPANETSRPEYERSRSTLSQSNGATDGWGPSHPNGNGTRLVNAMPTLISAANKLAQSNASATQAQNRRSGQQPRANVQSAFGSDPFTPDPKPSFDPFNPSSNGFANFDSAFAIQPPPSSPKAVNALSLNTFQQQSDSKYAALAELDELFKASAAPQSPPVTAAKYDPFVTPFSAPGTLPVTHGYQTAASPFFASSPFPQPQTSASTNPFLVASTAPSNPFSAPPQPLFLNLQQPAPFGPAPGSPLGSFGATGAVAWPQMSPTAAPAGGLFGSPQQFSAQAARTNPFL